MRELPDEKRNSQPDEDIADCPAVSPEGFLCTRNRLHYGRHDAKGVNDSSFQVWEDHSTVEDPED